MATAVVPAVSPAVAAALKGNEALFSGAELALLTMLVEEGQAQLFAHWPALGTSDADKRRMVSQIATLDHNYNGGLRTYIRNAKQLLADSKEGRNPFDGYTPSVPHGARLDFASDPFLKYEEAGVLEAGRSAYVLVAGGLGERLGYSGIKVALPTESASGLCFLKLYCEYILALQAKAAAGVKLPFAIMTSGDTHDRTVALLESHNYFGMDRDQVTLMKQEKVACLIDNEAHLALDPSDPFEIQTKPHGHGDVHGLLHRTGLVKKWAAEGFRWDTNALVFRALIAALGVSAEHDYDVNSLAVPRKAKEAVGAIALLKHTDGSSLTINVEYNQLDPLLRSTINPQGDVNDETGFSPFPGNINQLVLKVDSYCRELERSRGVIGEFVNPKYKDATKTAFKSSTRLECMMQDYPKCLPSDAKVGFTTINQVWASYSPVKNSAADARAKAAEHAPTHSATSAEFDMYKCASLTLKTVAGVDIPAPGAAVFNGVPVETYPRIVLSPGFAPTLADAKAKVKPGSLRIDSNSCLILDGDSITVEDLEVHGALVVRAAPGAKVAIRGLKVQNAGWEWRPLAEGEAAKEEEAIRGFRVVRNATAEFVFDKPGEYVLDGIAPA